MLVSSRVIVLALLAASPAAGFTLQSPSLRASRHPTRAASVTMAAGEDRPCLATTRRSALAAAAGILLANPSPSSAGGMASLREMITGEKDGAPRAAERMKMDKQGAGACETFQCIDITEDSFVSATEVSKFKAEEGGLGIRVPTAWNMKKGEAGSGVVATWTDPVKGGEVTLIKSEGQGLKFKDVEGQQALVAQQILKLDVVQLGNRVVKLLGADSLSFGKSRMLMPEKLILYTLGLKAEGKTIIVDVVMQGDVAWVLKCSSDEKLYNDYKVVFGAVLQSPTLK